MGMPPKIACIIGAGPAGLTAAMELLNRSDIKPLILEATNTIGGLSQTAHYQGNCVDIGGHRFFSKSDRIMEMWLQWFPLLENPLIANATDKVMLKRKRLSRILFLHHFFDYPLSLNPATFRKLGSKRTLHIGLSYLKTQLYPRKPEATLQDFFINRFGRELYQTFFEDYTQKVWGVPCSDIPSDWGAQRVKGVSIKSAVWHTIKKQLSSVRHIAQKQIETSLIEWFFYPKYGPGQLWEEAARRIEQQGGEIRRNCKVIATTCKNQQIISITVLNETTNQHQIIPCQFLLSSMPVKDFIQSLTDDAVPPAVSQIANGLVYRDFITIGVMIPREKCTPLADNWIYIQEREVLVGRIQVFNNWSPYLVANPDMIWLGLEYFCNEDDGLWRQSDDELKALARKELQQIGFIHHSNDAGDAVVIRAPKAYPAYFGTYHHFHIIRNYTDAIANLFLIGRNGMHRYNNMDHSMLSAIAAIENIVNHIETKDNIWAVNAEEEYHEEKIK